MSCEWGHEDCAYEGSEKCDSCFSESLCYKKAAAKKIKGLAKHQNKADKRGGSGFEYQNYKTNKALLNDEQIVCNMTLNSGATVLEKGDAHIRGLINIMEEYKTKTVQKARGKETFTIHKEWLDTLKANFKNSKQEFEFFDLRFSFRELDNEVYVILDQETLLSWIKTLETDRLKAIRADKKIKLIEKQKETLKGEMDLLRKQIEELKAEVEYEKSLKQTKL